MLQNFLKQAKELGVNLNSLRAQQLFKYLDLLREWNKVHNLCADASYQHMLAYHLLDSLSIVGSLNCEEKSIIDVGSGAGLPGIPLAIAMPSCCVTMVDSRTKKITFINHAINILQLSNAQTALTRIEQYIPTKKFDLVIARAFASLTDFVKLSGHLCAEQGQLVAMKSDPDEFLYGASVGEYYKITEIKKLKVPGVESKRCLVILQHNN